MHLFELELSLDIYLGVGLQGHIIMIFLAFREPPYLSPWWLHKFTFPPTVKEGSLFLTEIKQGATFSSFCFISNAINISWSCLVPPFAFLSFVLSVLLFKIIPDHRQKGRLVCLSAGSLPCV